METALNAQELKQLKDMVRTKGLNATARAIGIGKATLHRILHGGAKPAAETAGKIVVCLKGDMVTDGPAPEKEIKEPEPNPNQDPIRQKTDKQISEEIELHAQLVKTGVMEMMNSILLGRLNGEIAFTLKGAR